MDHDIHWEHLLQNASHLWLVALCVTIALALFLFILRRQLINHLKGWKLLMQYPILEVFSQTKGFFLLILSIYCGLQVLTLPPEIELYAWRLFSITFAIQLGLWANEGVTFVLHTTRILKRKEEDAPSGSITVFHLLAKVIIWSFVGIFLLGNLGFNITALVAGLGVGGIAVALAAQNILGDLFASLSIVIDRPFTIGDFIIVDDLKGCVEQIGLKTTRVKSLSGERLIFSNADLLKSRIRNFKHMEKRRVGFELGITMDTPLDKVKIVPNMVKKIIEVTPNTTFDRAHFKAIGDFSYNYEIIYYVHSRDHAFYLDRHQQINFQILEQFKKEGIQFAYPTSTLYLEKGSQL